MKLAAPHRHAQAENDPGERFFRAAFTKGEHQPADHDGDQAQPPRDRAGKGIFEHRHRIEPGARTLSEQVTCRYQNEKRCQPSAFAHPPVCRCHANPPACWFTTQENFPPVLAFELGCKLSLSLLATPHRPLHEIDLAAHIGQPQGSSAGVERGHKRYHGQTAVPRDGLPIICRDDSQVRFEVSEIVTRQHHGGCQDDGRETDTDLPGLHDRIQSSMVPLSRLPPPRPPPLRSPRNARLISRAALGPLPCI